MGSAESSPPPSTVPAAWPLHQASKVVTLPIACVLQPIVIEGHHFERLCVLTGRLVLELSVALVGRDLLLNLLQL